MNIEIKRLAMIEDAHVVIDGITVIAGKNNTGKSTVGKVLDSVFNSLSNIDKKISRERVLKVWSSLANIPSLMMTADVEAVCRTLLTERDSGKQKDMLLSYMPRRGMTQQVKDALDTLQKVQRLSDEDIKCTLVQRYFSEVFNGQINNIYNDGETALVSVNVTDGSAKIEFKDNVCTMAERGFAIANTSYYMDNPFVLDILNRAIRSFSRDSGIRMLPLCERNLYDALRSEADSDSPAIDSILANERLARVMELLNGVAPGEVVFDGVYFYKEDKRAQTGVNVNSLATGLKTFVIIKCLIRNGRLHEKDVLVVDEPEIHLHPEWLIRYAELLVALQKAFNLRILITTHSSDFLEAIDKYSDKYGIHKSSRYYLTQVDNNRTHVNDVTDCVYKIHEQLVDPIELLDKECNGDEDE